jgi:hypothetical protein
MKAFIITLFLLTSIQILAQKNLTAEQQATISKQMSEFRSEGLKTQKENAKKIYDLKADFLKESYEDQLKMIDEMASLSTGISPGKRDENKVIREKMKTFRIFFREESKKKRKAFREEKIKPLKLQEKEAQKARRKELKEKMKQLRKKK